MRALVRTYAQAGVPQQSIAKKTGISINTLRKHYGEILSVAKAETEALIGQTTLRMALGAPAEYAKDGSGNVIRDKDGNPVVARDEVLPDKTLLIFLSKTRLGMKETVVNENIDRPHDDPEFNTEGLSESERTSRIIALLERARARRVGRAANGPPGVDVKPGRANPGKGKQG